MGQAVIQTHSEAGVLQALPGPGGVEKAKALLQRKAVLGRGHSGLDPAGDWLLITGVTRRRAGPQGVCNTAGHLDTTDNEYNAIDKVRPH